MRTKTFSGVTHAINAKGIRVEVLYSTMRRAEQALVHHRYGLVFDDFDQTYPNENSSDRNGNDSCRLRNASLHVTLEFGISFAISVSVWRAKNIVNRYIPCANLNAQILLATQG